MATMNLATTVRDAEVVERQDPEVHEALAEEHRDWLDNGGLDELALCYASDPADDFTF